MTSGPDTIPMTVFLAVCSVLVTVIAGLVTILLKHMAHDVAKAEHFQDSLAQSSSTLTSLVGLTRENGARELADYKLQATREFASVAHLQEVEARLVKHLERLEDLLTRVLRTRRDDDDAADRAQARGQ